MKALTQILISIFIVAFASAQTTPINNPKIQGSSGTIISGATLTNNGTFTNADTINGNGTFNLSGGTVTLPATVGGLASWPGTTGITTLGTITTGVWNGTAIGVSYGGSGQSSLAASAQAFLDSISTTQGTLLYNNGTDWVSLAPGTSGHFLKTLGAGANPVWAAGGSGIGDVVGPASSVTNRIALFDGTTGKLIKDSGALLSDYLTTATAASTYQPLDADLTSWGAITRASGFDTFTATPTLANLSSLVSDANIARTDAAQTFAGIQTLSDTTASTGTGTGALRVAGGLDTAKDSFFNSVRVGRGAANDVGSLVAGGGALAGIVSGVNNTAVGASALEYITTTSNNVAIGAGAGQVDASLNPLTGVVSAVYIGKSVRGTISSTNEIAIGHTALGLGSNTTVIGNSSTTAARIFGRLTMGTNAAPIIFPASDGTNGQALVTNGSGTLSFATVAASGATLAANTYTGLQQFSGTTHAGLRLNNLTTAERDALTSPAAGMAIWNTTDARLQLHNGSAWTSGMVRLSGDTMTGALSVTLSALGTTTTAGSSLINSTAAAAGAQQVSPALLLRGNGWKTTATAASQTVDFIQDVLPVQGTTAPTGTWRLRTSINGGAAASVMEVDSVGALYLPNGAAGAAGKVLQYTSGVVELAPGITTRLSGTSLIGIVYPGNSSSAGSFQSDGTGNIAMRGGYDPSVAQELSIYKVDSGANDELAKIGWRSTTDVFTIETSKTGTGTARPLVIRTDGTERLRANASGVTIGASGTATPLIKHGTAVLVAGTVTVSDTDVVAGSRIFINRQTDGGTIGDSYSITRSAGVSFTITSKTANATVTGDTSTLSYLIINP